MAKVFVSYSRKDIDFARRLTAELEKSELDFWIDWEGIPPTVDWWREIEKGIEEADIFLFLISPDSAKSKVCGHEIDCAVKNGKRLIPLVVRETKADERPSQLSHLNFIYFRENDDFNASLTKLLTSIHTDYEWVATHCELQVKALEWERGKKESSFLLRGKELENYEFQLDKNKSKKPHTTDLQREYLHASRKATNRQRYFIAVISIAGVITLAVLAIWGWGQAVSAKIAQAKAEANEAAAQAASTLAVSNANTAEANLVIAQTAQAQAETETRIANSGRLALESKSALVEFPQRALLLALEAVRINRDANEPIRSDAEEALRLATERVSGIGLPGFRHEVSLVQFTDDNRWLVAGTNALEGEAEIWNLDRLLNETNYMPFYASFPVEMDEEQGIGVSELYLSPHMTWLVSSSYGQTQLWKIDTQNEDRESLKFQGEIVFAHSKNDYDILEKQTDKAILWQIDPENLTKKELTSFDGSFVAFSQDHKYLITHDPQEGILRWNFSAPADAPTLLTPTHATDYRLFLIDPNNRWLILFQDVPHDDIQIPAYNEMGIYVGTKPWASTNIIIMPLNGPSNPQPYTIKLQIAIDLIATPPKFSPDANALAFVGSSSLAIYGFSRENFGILRLIDQGHTYLLSEETDSDIYRLSFINKDWLYIGSKNFTTIEKSMLLDLRQDDLFSDADLSTSLLLDKEGKVVFSDDRKSILTQDEKQIDFELLDLTHTVELNPIPEISANSSRKELLTKLENDPQSVGLEDKVQVRSESSDKQWLAVGARDGSLRLWSTVNPWKSSTIRLPQSANYIAFSNDNKWMAINNALWQLKDGKPALEIPIEDKAFNGIAVFSPDSRWLAYVQGTEVYQDFFPQLKAKIIDLTRVSAAGEIEPTAISTLSSVNGTYIVEMQFSADSRWLKIKGASYIYDLENKRSYTLPYPVSNFAFIQGQHIILYELGDQTSNGHPEIWELPTTTSKQFVKIGELETGDPSLISQNGRWLLSAPDPSNHQKNARKLWDLSCVIEKRECIPFELQANQAGFSPDSSHLLAGYKTNANSDEMLKFDIWDLGNWNQINNPVIVYSGQTRMEVPGIGNSGNLLVSASKQDSYINLAGLFSSWNGYGGLGFNVTTFDGYGKWVSISLAALSYTVGTFQRDYNVEALVLKDLNQTRSNESILLRGHESNISISHISPNERFVLTYSGGGRDTGGSAERLFRLWDLDKIQFDPTTKPVILPLTLEPQSYITALAFSPDSRWVYIVESGSILHYFPTSVEDLMQQACIAIGRNFIINEWERFFPKTAYQKTCKNLPVHPSVVTE